MKRELVQIGFQVWHGQTETDLVGLFGKGILKRSSLHGVGTQPNPGGAAVAAHRRSPHTDGVPVGKVEPQGPSGSSADSKVPVEPET